MGKKSVKIAQPESDSDHEESGAIDFASNPALLAAIQKQLEGRSSGYLESLPADVKRRVNALKNLQVKHAKLSADYEKEVAALDLKYAALNKPIFQQRTQIVGGGYEPTDEEAHFSDEEDDEEEEEEKKEEKKDETPVKGIPHFWLTALQRSDFIAEKIQEYDVPVLEHLTDITVTPNEAAGTGFTLNFHFSQNEFFTDAVLTKTYTIDIEGEEGALMYTGPMFSGTTGCDIHWNAGKNVTVKSIKKKQKKKGGKDAGSVRVVTKLEKVDSFFNFFSPPAVPTDEDEAAEETQAKLEEDFEMGDFIREKLVADAVLWFTGEALDYEDDYGYGGEEGEGFDGEEGDSDTDPDFKPKPAGPGAAGQKPECKQS
jgi:nucleosome assembly protein 1-like 1